MDKELNAGYEILRRKRVGNKEFVLGFNPNAPEPYVTWKCNAGTTDYYWGKYFSDESRALKNFNQRVKEEKSYERQ